jgi:hypothetical protein
MENLKGRDHLEDIDVNMKIILEWMLGKNGVRVWTGRILARIGASGGCFEHGYETSGSVKSGEFD